MSRINRKKLLLAAAAAIALLTALTVARCTAVHAPEAQEQPEAQAEGGQDGGGGEGLPDGDPLALLGESDRAKIAGYDADALDFVALLETHKWADANQASTLAFADNAFTISRSDGSVSEPLAFAVRVLDTEVLSNGDTVPLKAYTASVASAQGDYLVRVDRASDGTWRVASALFGGAKATYYMVASDSALSVDVDMEALDAATDGHGQALADELRSYCANLFPAARTATWTGEAAADYAKHTAGLHFTLDNRAASRVEVVYDAVAQTFTFGNASNPVTVPASGSGEAPDDEESEGDHDA